MPGRQYYVYVMSNAWRTIYIGVTNDLMHRVAEHKAGTKPGFTHRYGLSQLVYYEQTEYVRSAIAREKQLKGWRRERKLVLIESQNPNWRDLSLDWDPGADSSLRSE